MNNVTTPSQPTGDLAEWPALMLCGPRDEAIATDLRARGHRIAHPNRLQPPTMAAAREVAETMLWADALLCLPGWEDDPDACVSVEIAEVLDLPIIDWEDWTTPGDGWIWTLATPRA
jgi:hypothetical protein